MAQNQARKAALDERLLTHHPAGKACLEVCAANGWLPSNADMLRLVKLWSAVREGDHSEIVLSRAHLNFVRWLRDHGRINEGTDGLNAAA